MKAIRLARTIGRADEVGASVKKYAPEITRREIEQPGFK
jgi:hypothetical protein